MIRLFVLVGAVLLTTGLVLFETSGAFFGTAKSTGTLGTGTVELSDSALRGPNETTGAPLFVVTDMGGGQAESRCVRIAYTGTIFPADITMYGETTGALSRFLTITVEVLRATATPTDNTVCRALRVDRTLFPNENTRPGRDTLRSFFQEHKNMSDGLPVWSPTSPADSSVVLRITLRLQDNPAAQSQTTTPGFVWEVTHR
jgi:hypothetical protein